MTNFKIDIDADGIALIVFDAPGKSMNTISAEVIQELAAIAERLKTDAALKGAVFASGKDSGFCAGADLNSLFSGDMAGASPKAVLDAAFAMNRALRALETNGKPVAIALEGLALGGGLEIALACHYRVAADNPKIKLGLPESKIGLLPGGGGTQRLPRLIGTQPALMMMLLGENKTPADGKMLGFIDELVAPGKTIEAAKAWVKGKTKVVARWDEKGFKIPGGGPYTPSGVMVFIGANAMLAKQTYGNYPQQTNILKAVYEGLQVPMDAALRIETRYFAKTLMGPTAKGMMRTLFVSLQELGKGGNRPASVAKYDVKKVAVIGAGLMGAGIAYVSAKAGIETVLIDVNQDAADKGKDYSKKIVEKDLSRARTTQEKGDALLARIEPSTDYAKIDGADLIIEAVFENPALKADIIKQAEPHLPPNAVFGTNTSTLPITGLAESSQRRANFIGIHFFSPVERMGLVELIRGKETTEETVAKAIDYVLKIGKTPIVVNDHRGFYMSRCFSTYTTEGLEMLLEGVAPAIIENVGRQSGMPMGPLEVSDSVGLDTALKIGRANAEAAGKNYKTDPRNALLSWIVEDKGRIGRKAGKGFYDYPGGGAKNKIWPGLAERVAVKIDECPPALRDEYKKRLLYIQALETARCFDEGVITDPRDADVGSILAWGFAPYTGGVISMMDLMGLQTFVNECDALAAKYGDRFKPNTMLRDMAKKGETFYGRFGAQQKAA